MILTAFQKRPSVPRPGGEQLCVPLGRAGMQFTRADFTKSVMGVNACELETETRPSVTGSYAGVSDSSFDFLRS